MIKYDELCSKVKNGDLLSFHGNTTYAKIVRWWTKSNFSHVGLAAWFKFPSEEKDRLFLLEANGDHVCLSPLAKRLEFYSKEMGKMYWQPLMGIDGDKLIGEGLKLLGNPYRSQKSREIWV